jgi:hypothetical protein
MKKSLIAVGLASALFGGVLAHAAPASAWWTRQYGSSLWTHESEYGRIYGEEAEYAVLSTSSMPMTDAATINVEVYHLRADSLSNAQICAKYWTGAGMTCSATQTHSGSGKKTYDFSGDEAVWNTASQFPFVKVFAKAANGGNVEAARVSGIFISN